MPDIWSIPPAQFSVGIGSNTKVLSARNAEWRYSNHDARLTFNWSRVLRDGDAFDLETTFRKNALGTWVFPMFGDMTTFDSISVGDTFQIDPNTRISAGDTVVIAGDGKSETGTVQSFAAGTLVLTAPIGQAYSSGDRGKPFISPAFDCISTGLNREVSFNRTKISATFVALKTIDAPNPSYPEYLGSPVLIDGHNKLGGFGGAIKQKHAVIDDGFGNYAVAATETYERSRSQIAFTADKRDRQRRVMDFLIYAHGKDARFWVPAWRKDLTITAPAATNDSVISIANTSQNPADLIGSHIMLHDRSNRQFVKITNAAVSGGDIVLSVSPNLTAPITTATKCSGIDLSRIDSNSLTVTYVPTINGPYMTAGMDVVEVTQ